MVNQKKLVPATTVRWTESDSEIVLALQEKTGIQSITDIVRQAIRALAAKEGVTA